MLGLIIYGSRTITTTAGTGQFACPRCCMMRTYSHRNLRAFFTLYFIPLIPLWKAGEYVECGSCGGTYGMEVLSLSMEDLALPSAGNQNLPNLPYDEDSPFEPPPARDARAELTANVRRALVLFVASLGKATPAVMQEFRQSFKELIYADLSEEQVLLDYQQAKAAGATVATFVPQQLGRQSDDVKQIVMQVATRVAAAEGMITSTGQAALLQFGESLALDPAVVQAIIQRRGRS